MPKKALKIVVVEDEAEDVLLMKRALEKAGLAVDFTPVSTKKELNAALETGDWDVILSDFNLPRMNGLDALRIRQEKRPLIPFIVVTGSIGEESAIELMKAGADDYIIKNNVRSLATAVQRAVRTAAIREGKRRTQTLLNRTRAMLEGIADGIEDNLILISPKYSILWANRAALESLGSSLPEVRGRTCHAALFQRATPCTPPDRNCPLQDGRNRTNGSSVYFQKGRTLEIKTYPVRFGKHRSPCHIHVGRDITALQETRAESVRNLNRLQKLLRDTIEALTGTLELRDPFTAGHQKKVSRLAVAIARDLGIPQHSLEGVYMSAIVHDLGKAAIPSEILAKPGLLEPIEFEMIKTHPHIGHELLKKIDFPWPVAQAVLEHHERLDGSGYPNGLKEDRICLEAKILAVADVVEAIASHRPYRPALGLDIALEEIEKHAGTLYDRRSAEACLRLFRENKFRFDYS